MNGSEPGRSRQVRAAINENTFREINEQLVATVALEYALRGPIETWLRRPARSESRA